MPVAGLNTFFTIRHYKMKIRSSREKFGHFWKKLMVYHFSISTIPFERGPGQMFPMPSFLMRPCWDRQKLIFLFN